VRKVVQETAKKLREVDMKDPTKPYDIGWLRAEADFLEMRLGTTAQQIDKLVGGLGLCQAEEVMRKELLADPNRRAAIFLGADIHAVEFWLSEIERVCAGGSAHKDHLNREVSIPELARKAVNHALTAATRLASVKATMELASGGRRENPINSFVIEAYQKDPRQKRLSIVLEAMQAYRSATGKKYKGSAESVERSFSRIIRTANKKPHKRFVR